MSENQKDGAVSQLDGLKSFISEQLENFGQKFVQVDQLDGKIEEAVHTLQKSGMDPNLTRQITELEKRIKENTTRIDAGELAGSSAPAQGSSNTLRKSLDSSDYLKQVQSVNGRCQIVPGSAGLKVPSLTMHGVMMERAAQDVINKALQKATIASGQAPVPVQYRADMIDYSLERSSLAGRVPRVDVQSDTYSFLQETQLSGNGGIVTQADGLVAADTTPDITLDSVENMVAGGQLFIERTDGSGVLLGYEERRILSFSPGTRVVTTTAPDGTADNIQGDVADNDKVSFTRFAATAEQAQKPYSFVEALYTSITMECLAVLASLTTKALRHNMMLESWIRNRMVMTHLRNLAWHLLYGPGTAGTLQGLLTKSGRQEYLWSSGAAGDTLADAVLKAALVMPDDSMPIEVTMRRQNWLQLLTEKAADGHYVNTNMGPVQVINTPTLKAIGSYPVFTEAMLESNGDFLVASHSMAHELAVFPGSAQFLFGYVNADFAKNMTTARYEEELGHAILSDQWYVHGQFDARPTP